jgi:hypothetical protein
VFDRASGVMSAPECYLAIALRYWRDAFLVRSLEWPLVHPSFGNAMASMVWVATRWSSMRRSAAEAAFPREHANGREDRHDVSVVQPRDRGRSVAYCPNSVVIGNERKREEGLAGF